MGEGLSKDAAVRVPARGVAAAQRSALRPLREPMVQDPLLSVVVPVFNELATLESVVERVLAVPVRKQLILVDDGSTDGSGALVQRLAERPEVQAVVHPTNQGKGAALRSGFAVAAGDLVVVQDADLEYDPAEYPALIAPIVRGEADVVYGSRFLGGPTVTTGRRLDHTLGNRFLTWCSNLFTGLDLTDMETCFKCVRREALQALSIESERFAVEPELTSKLAGQGLRFYEVPISYRRRRYSEGKKITWRDGVSALWAIVRFR